MKRRSCAWLATGAVVVAATCGGGLLFLARALSPFGSSDGLIEIEDPRPARAVVRVTDDVGRPLAGARVEAFLEPPWGDGLGREFDPGSEPTPARTVTTDSDGLVALDELVLGDWVLAARAPGHATSFLRFRGGHDARLDFLLDLGVARRLSGRVLDDDHRPVADAVVLACYGLDRLFEPAMWLAANRARSGPSSEFAFDDLASGIATIWVVRPNDIPAEAGRVLVPCRDSIELVIPSQKPYVVEVRDLSGNAVAGTQVGVEFLAGDATLRGTTDPEGRVEIPWTPPREGIASGLFEVSVRAPGWSLVEDHSRLADAPPSSPMLSLVVQPGGAVEGIVRGPDGPVAGAEVWPVFGWFTDAGERWRSTLTGADGRFRLESLPRGKYSLRARAPGVALGPADVDVRIEAGSTARAEIVLRPDTVERSSIRGRIDADDRSPLDGAHVSALHHDEYGNAVEFAWAWAADAGTYTLDGVPSDARIALRASAAGHRDIVTSWKRADEFADVVEFFMLRGARIEGIVRTADGSTPPDLRVWIRRVEESHDVTVNPLSLLWAGTPVRDAYVASTPLSEGGRFETAWLHEPGRLIACATAEGFAPTVSAPFDIATDPISVEIVLDPGETLRGRIVGADGSPLAGCPVRIRPPGLNEVWEATCATSDTDGRFAVPHLPARPIHVSAGDLARGFGRATVTPSTEEIEIRVSQHAPEGPSEFGKR